ncbi:MAG: hypothetical protein RJP95_04380 [Pirellulales bacterium]
MVGSTWVFDPVKILMRREWATVLNGRTRMLTIGPNVVQNQNN